MRNIWRIIKADARSLFTHFFALAVALAIAVLPSLYAWLNIYSNWDPYGNTGNISIAVASLDKGWTEEDGAQVNKGREVVEDLRSSTSINWVIVDTKEEAERGVYAGDYYAAVVIDEDFSYNMYHMLTEWTDKPTITYYENYKKNAVATKITDTAVSSLKTTISKSYLDGVVDAIFRGANDLSQQLSQEDPVGSVQGLLARPAACCAPVPKPSTPSRPQARTTAAIARTCRTWWRISTRTAPTARSFWTPWPS